MAVQKLKIIVESGGRSSGGGDSAGGVTTGVYGGKKSKLYKVLNFNETLRNKVKQSVSPSTFFALQSGVSVAVQTARQFANYYISDIGRKNGDSNYQAIVNRRIEVATDSFSLGQGALGGAASGAAFGIGGAIAGAVIGAISAGINLGFKYAERERAYQHVMFQENNSQAYNLARANYSALTGRVR